jgi:hypothetical protein
MASQTRYFTGMLTKQKLTCRSAQTKKYALKRIKEYTSSEGEKKTCLSTGRTEDGPMMSNKNAVDGTRQLEVITTLALGEQENNGNAFSGSTAMSSIIAAATGVTPSFESNEAALRANKELRYKLDATVSSSLDSVNTILSTRK